MVASCAGSTRSSVVVASCAGSRETAGTRYTGVVAHPLHNFTRGALGAVLGYVLLNSNANCLEV